MRTGTVCSLTMEDIHALPQTISSRSAASSSAGRSCRKSERWKQVFGIRAKTVRSAARVFVPKVNRAKYCPDCAARVPERQKTESERKKEVLCGQLGAEKSLIYKALQAQNRGRQ